MKALLLGGTGMVGSKLLEKLLLNDSIEQVTVITRRPLEKNDQNPKIRQVVLESFDDPQAFPVDRIKGHDVLFNCMVIGKRIVVSKALLLLFFRVPRGLLQEVPKPLFE